MKYVTLKKKKEKTFDIYFNSLYRTSRNGNNTSRMG